MSMYEKFREWYKTLGGSPNADREWGALQGWKEQQKVIDTQAAELKTLRAELKVRNDYDNLQMLLNKNKLKRD